MKVRRFLALASLALLPLCSMQAKTQAADDAQMNRFIDGLMAKMTLQEKIGQLNSHRTSQEQRHRRKDNARRGGRTVQS